MSAGTVFEAALSRAEAGIPATFTARHSSGALLRFDPATWCRDALPGDAGLLARCAGATLDIGCGPGRLTSALAGTGRPALGIDISAAAVRLTRARGAAALQRDVFDPLPGAGRWHDLLLADGNIGIGGDPHELLRRCRRLLAPGGRLHAELAAPGAPAWSGTATVQSPDALAGRLRWASVPHDRLPALAAGAAMRVAETWTEAGRWFATLTPR